MGHGTERNIVISSDGEHFPVETELIDQFNNDKLLNEDLRNLIGIPKIFLLNYCRLAKKKYFARFIYIICMHLNYIFIYSGQKQDTIIVKNVSSGRYRF